MNVRSWALVFASALVLVACGTDEAGTTDNNGAGNSGENVATNAADPDAGDNSQANSGTNNADPDMGVPLKEVPRQVFSISGGASNSSSARHSARIVVGAPQPMSTSSSPNTKLILGPNAERP